MGPLDALVAWAAAVAVLLAVLVVAGALYFETRRQFVYWKESRR